MVSLWESHNPASILAGNIESGIRALHIADEHFIEVLHRFEHLFKVALGVVGVDDYRYLVFLIHGRKDTIKKPFFKRFAEKYSVMSSFSQKNW
jgi:hypothetical protein